MQQDRLFQNFFNFIFQLLTVQVLGDDCTPFRNIMNEYYARGDDDFTPFRNIMNEYYARDTSRKIRSTFQSKGKSGKHLTGTVIYGYLWNEARD